MRFPANRILRRQHAAASNPSLRVSASNETGKFFSTLARNLMKMRRQLEIFRETKISRPFPSSKPARAENMKHMWMQAVIASEKNFTSFEKENRETGGALAFKKSDTQKKPTSLTSAQIDSDFL